ncbi:MAG: hypothetical protein ACRDJI_05930 [Actinomycetota bacterium]
MDRKAGRLSTETTDDGSDEDVVRLPTGLVETPPPPPTPPGRLHGAATAGAALFGGLSLVSALSFVTVTWPEDTGRYVKVALVGSVLAFIVCSVTAIFAAARDTYAPGRKGRDEL